MAQWFHIGTISKPHGLRGEVRVMGDTDFPEERFAVGQTLYLDRNNGEESIPLVITSHRKNKQFELICFEGYENINDVEAWKGAALEVPGDQLGSLEEDEYYHHDILGCCVITEEDEELGEITDILSTGANDVWVVQGVRPKDILVPYIDDVVKEVDVEEKIVRIHVLEGMLE